MESLMFKPVKMFAKHNVENKSFSFKTTQTSYCSLNVLPMLLKNLESMLNNEHSAHEKKRVHYHNFLHYHFIFGRHNLSVYNG